MDFNTFVYFTCVLLVFVAISLHLFDRRLLSRGGGGVGTFVRNSEFIKFRRSFLIGYVTCLFADSLQAPYLYYLYQSYGFLEWQIAVLYVSGFVTNIIFNMAAVYLVQRTERRMLCCVFAALSSLSCVMKFSTIYPVLMLSRITDGIAAALLSAPFQEWYVHEHMQSFDFPKEWIPVTFRFVAILSGYSAVGAGFLAEFTESTFKITAFPFLLSIPLLIGSGLWICNKWPENRLDPSMRPKFWPQFGNAFRSIVRKPNVFLLSVIQSLFESAFYVFIFLWTPLFFHLTRVTRVRPPFGAIYSAFMAAALVGTVLQRVLSRRLITVNLLSVAAALSFVGMTIAVTVSYPGQESSGKFEVMLWSFCIYELGVGLYFPVMQRLQKDILPAENRAAILSLFRIPLNGIASFGLLALHGHEMFGNWMLLIVCMVLLMLCLLASFLLHGMIKRQSAADVDHFVFDLKNDVGYDTE